MVILFFPSVAALCSVTPSKLMSGSPVAKTAAETGEAQPGGVED